jgi:hypothetical protein
MGKKGIDYGGKRRRKIKKNLKNLKIIKRKEKRFEKEENKINIHLY